MKYKSEDTWINYWLISDLLDIWVYNFETGEILSKLDTPSPVTVAEGAPVVEYLPPPYIYDNGTSMNAASEIKDVPVEFREQFLKK